MEYFTTIPDYCQGINISPPKHEDFDIRRFEDNMATVASVMPPFRHAFYAIALKVDGHGQPVTGHHTQLPSGNSIFFNSPFQILSWDIVPDWKGYYVIFSKDFLARSVVFTDFLSRFPFLKIENAAPLAISQDQANILTSLFAEIYATYHSEANDKFDFIALQTLLLLQYVKRYFYAETTNRDIEEAVRSADIKLLSRYQSLIELRFRTADEVARPRLLHSTSYYAEALNVHPNHLNAIVKSVTGHTALRLIHQHVLQLAKSRLIQTSKSVKEIAYELHFASPNSFSTFFKKQTTYTPNAYRKRSRL